jgi:PhoH-like ATPase
VVIDEIDSKKSVLGEIGYQARSFGRLITKAEKLPDETTTYMYISKYRTEEGAEVWIIGVNDYPTFDKYEEHNIKNDRKILHTADLLCKQYENCTFITNDIMCGIRANPMGIPTTELRVVNEAEYEFTKVCLIDEDIVFRSLHNEPIANVDPEYTPMNYNYKFMNTLTGQVKLATITTNGLIDIIGKTTEQELRRQDVNPANSGQLFLSAAIQDPLVDVIVCEAAAGTGKTVTAISNAMRLIKQNNPYDTILYIRASIDDVDDVEKVGYLSGNEEKFAVYLHPLEDTLDFIVRNRHKNSRLKGEEFELFISEEIEKTRSKYNIQALTGLGMRGRTFSNTIAIIDEIQGQTKASVQKMITRFGKDCKLILIGSNKQIDNPYVTRYSNGLSVILEEAAKGSSDVNIKAVPLEKIVRSDIAEWAEKIFSNKG